MSVSMCVCRVFRSWTAITSRVCFIFTPSVSGIGIRMNRKKCMNENCLCYSQHSLYTKGFLHAAHPCSVIYLSYLSPCYLSLCSLTRSLSQTIVLQRKPQNWFPHTITWLCHFFVIDTIISFSTHWFFNFSLYYFHFIVLLQVRTSSLSSNIFTWAHFGETYDCANCNIERATTCAHIHIASHFTLALSLALTHMLNNLSVVSFCVSSIFLYHFIELGCLGLIITLILQKAKLFSNSKSLIIFPLWWKLR